MGPSLELTNISELLNNLEEKRACITEAIAAVEKIVSLLGLEPGDGSPSRRGRPPGAKNKPKVDEISVAISQLRSNRNNSAPR